MPGAHAVGAVAPLEQAEPAGQIEHSLCAVPPVAPRKLPAAQLLCALAPRGQYVPAEHTSHAVAPPDDWYVPAAHSVQLLRPLDAVNEPGMHAVDSVARDKHRLPAGHVTHDVAPLAD